MQYNFLNYIKSRNRLVWVTDILYAHTETEKIYIKTEDDKSQISLL